MLKQGLLLYDGYEYTVYEQVVDSFRRLDICERGANFHTDVDSIRCSVVQHKGTYTYGDISIYERLMGLLDAAHQLNTKEEVTNSWELSTYCTRRVRTLPDRNFLEETVQHNGKPNSYSVQLGGIIYTTFVVSEYSEAKMLPMNYAEYKDVTLKDTGNVTEARYHSLAVLRARHDIAHLDECDFEVADDVEFARNRLERWLKQDAPLKGVDTETTGVDVDLYGVDSMVGIILSYKYGEATYFPFSHEKFGNLSEDFLQNELMPAIKSQEHILVAHNKKFERKVFLRLGWDIRIKYDTLPLSCLVDPTIERGAHELKNLMFKLTGQKFLELTDIFPSSKLINFQVLPKEIVRLYACPDASSLLLLYPNLWEKLPSDSRYIAEVEYDLADVKADQEYYGLRVDVEKFMRNLDNCDYILNLLLTTFKSLTHLDGNINSNEVMSNLIFGKMRCPVLVRTKTGKPSTGKASIKKLASMRADTAQAGRFENDIVDMNGTIIIKAKDLSVAKYPELVVLEQYRIYSKLRTAFYSRFERTLKSGRVFFWVNQNGASSGRQSSPMHQLPPELKDVIISDSPDHNMWDPDYSQIELRKIAFLAGEKELIELCKDPENDIHRAIGSLITGQEMWEISAEERSIGKRRNFGVIYLISAYGLAGQIAGAGYTDEDVKRADKALEEFFNRFKRIKKYIAQNAERVKRDGYVRTWFGRYKYFPEVFDPDISSKKLSSILRKANNLPVQGTAADYLKLAETNMYTYIRNKGWDEIMENGFPRARVALSIHDEILLMCDKSIPYEEIILMIRDCMEMPIDGAPPFFCSPSLVQSWAQHSDDSVAMPVKLRDQLIADYKVTGVSKINDENYKEVLKAYSDNLLHDYMQDLIQRYGLDPQAVAEHVRHPSLTHDLIAQYSAPKELRLSHEESIRYATVQYMGQAEVMAACTKTEDYSWKEAMLEAEPLVNFDPEGKVVYENPEEEEEGEWSVYDDERYIMKLTEGTPVYVWELMDALCIDITKLSEDSANAVIQKVWENRESEGFYRILFIRADKMLDGGFRVEDIDKVALEEFIKEEVSREAVSRPQLCG